MKRNHSEELGSTLGHRIRSMRKAARVSQESFGKVLGVHQSAVCRIEQGTQSLTPDQLFAIAKFFDVNLDALLVGRVDTVAVAEKFQVSDDLPTRYQAHRHSMMREVLPFIELARALRGDSFVRSVLRDLGVKEALTSNPDFPIGVLFLLDFVRELVQKEVLDLSNPLAVVAMARSEKVQGFLHHVYESQTLPIRVVANCILNSHHYNRNFEYRIREVQPDSSIKIEVTAAPHMSEVEFKDGLFGDFGCRYTRAYIGHMPAYIGKEPISIEEEQCMYHGAPSCVYRIKA